jgi:hypothetical protein
MIEEFRHDHLTTFAGLPVFEFNLPDDEGVRPETPADAENWAWRIALEYSDDGAGYPELLEAFLAEVDSSRVKALILGFWSDEDMEADSDVACVPLIERAERFPALEALFIGDTTYDQIEVSWIYQSDPSPVLAAFPGLRVFGLRGTTNLSMAPLRHAALEELVLQGGGLPPEVVRAVGASELPALTELQLYLGSHWYSGGATGRDLAPILHGGAFPRLRHLGLRDADNQDDIAAEVAHAPVVAQLESLDLSLGNLSDSGAAALISGQSLSHLKKLDLHHHYLTEEMMQRVWAAFPGIEVNLDEQETQRESGTPWPGDEDPERALRNLRYIAVSE